MRLNATKTARFCSWGSCEANRLAWLKRWQSINPWVLRSRKSCGFSAGDSLMRNVQGPACSEVVRGAVTDHSAEGCICHNFRFPAAAQIHFLHIALRLRYPVNSNNSSRSSNNNKANILRSYPAKPFFSPLSPLSPLNIRLPFALPQRMHKLLLFSSFATCCQMLLQHF